MADAIEVIEEKETDGILYITLNRPDKLNAFIEPMRAKLSEALKSLMHRKEVRVCVITGAGRAFCAGGDIRVMQGIIADRDFDTIQKFLKWGREIVTTIRALPIPVVAAVNGPAAGAGMNLALACDIRLVSTQATFGQTFINIGLHPDWGGTYFLPRLTNVGCALDLALTGRIISAQEAMGFGIANALIPHEQFAEKVHAYARLVCQKSEIAVRLIKKGVYSSESSTLADVLRHEEQSQAECIRSLDAASGMDRFFQTRIKVA
ncbi:MAG: enoyl-CoA hydratase/isomerase family protein [Deltaproteobacteria bacterium]|nr:enoyl-CoA hydratase/isomerase family protein [Deltaproteobacteria bacterium]